MSILAVWLSLRRSPFAAGTMMAFTAEFESNSCSGRAILKHHEYAVLLLHSGDAASARSGVTLIDSFLVASRILQIEPM